MPQCAHSHRQHSPTRATNQKFLVFIRHPELQLKGCHSEPQLKECHVLNPYPEPQLKGYIMNHISRNTKKPTFEASPKPSRPRTLKASKLEAWSLHYCLALLLSHQAKHASRPPGGGHVPPGAKRLCTHWLCVYRLTELTLSPGATCSQPFLILSLSSGEAYLTVKRYTSSCAILVFSKAVDPCFTHLDSWESYLLSIIDTSIMPCDSYTTISLFRT